MDALAVCGHPPVAKAIGSQISLCGRLQLLQGGKGEQGLCICLGWAARLGGEGGSVGAAQAVDHAVDPGDVVVGGADELEQALQGVLPQHPGSCRERLVMMYAASFGPEYIRGTRNCNRAGATVEVGEGRDLRICHANTVGSHHVTEVLHPL